MTATLENENRQAPPALLRCSRRALMAFGLGAGASVGFFNAMRPSFAKENAPQETEAFLHEADGATPQLLETPYFAARVANGDLPQVEGRVPFEPFIRHPKNLGRVPGVQGGTMRLLMGDSRDTRFMTVYSYTRLIAFNRKLDLDPDILYSIAVEDDIHFTLRLRKGHRWSDGAPFTTEDFRFLYEDVYQNAKLTPGGPPIALRAGGEFAELRIIDETHVRYSFAEPAPYFLPALADSFPLYLCAPAHYLKQFHSRYADKAALDALVKAAHVKDWTALYERKARQFRPDNPDLPSLDAWCPRTFAPSELFVFARNPYFHRIDSQGRQLPYIDEVTIALSSTGLIPAKTGAGESDLQARFLNFADYTFLKEAEKAQNFTVRLWEKGEGSFVALYPNFNAKDDGWRTLMRTRDFRRALSLGINRHDLNQILCFGLAHESANTILPQSPLFEERYRTAFATYDPKQANILLDALGLDKVDSDGIRLMPDGRRAEFTIETAGDTTLTDLLALVCEFWLALGIKAYVHTTALDVFRKRVWSGETVMAADTGLDNAAPSPKMEPVALCPCLQSQFQWPLFGQYVESNGKEGTAIDMPSVAELARLHEAWRHSRGEEERIGIWKAILDLHASEVFTIGTLNATLQPVVVKKNLKNVPDKALYAYEPTAYFGAYHPDLFFFSPET